MHPPQKSCWERFCHLRAAFLTSSKSREAARQRNCTALCLCWQHADGLVILVFRCRHSHYTPPSVSIALLRLLSLFAQLACMAWTCRLPCEHLLDKVDPEEGVRRGKVELVGEHDHGGCLRLVLDLERRPADHQLIGQHTRCPHIHLPAATLVAGLAAKG